MRPGWAKPCECGKVPRGVYCEECRAFGDGYAGGTWERPSIEIGRRSPEPVRGYGRELGSCHPPTVDQEETYCPGGHRGATVRGNAAYCAECGGRIRPTASSSASGVGTGH